MNSQPPNRLLIGDDEVMGEEFAAMLPNATEAFDVTMIDGLNYTQFYEAVFEARNYQDPTPYSFGSF